MKPLPRNVNLTLFAAFATFMVATRFHHFGDVLHLLPGDGPSVGAPLIKSRIKSGHSAIGVSASVSQK